MAQKQYRRQRAPGKKAIIPILCAGILLVLTLTVWLSCLSPPFPRLEAAGFQITEDAYLGAMYRARSDVLSHHAAAGISVKDWHEETALGDPCRMVTERALEILSEYYAVSTLAVERGYLADAGFDALYRDMEAVNRRRQEALDAGEVITGLPHFTLDDYIAYRASNIRLQFCNDPANPENDVTQDDIRQRYEADRDTLYYQPDSLELAYLTVRAAAEELDTLEQAFRALQHTAQQTGDLAAALAVHPELAAYYGELSVHPDNYAVYDRTHSDILACAAGLESGDISQVFCRDGWLCLVQCRRRTVHRYIPLADVESVVVQSIRESRYDALIMERMNETEILGDRQALYRFTAEQLP